MTPYERQKAEIETIKPRSFTLELSDADVKRLYEKAYSNGITPAQLLQDYIGDLLDGTYTRGSDERMYAQQYFDRCIYTWPDDPRSFLQWALEEYRIDDIADELETLDYATGDIQYYAENTDDPPQPGELDDLRASKAEAESELAAIYEEYTASKGNEPYSDGIAAIRRYLAELQSMIEKGACK